MGREYLQRVRTKSFVISTISVPLLMVASIAIPATLAMRRDGQSSQVVLVDRSGVLSTSLIERLEDGGFAVEVISPDTPEMEAAFAEAREGEISGILEVDSTTLVTGGARWSGEDAPSTLRRSSVEHAVTQSALSLRLGRAFGEGQAREEIERLLEGGELEVVTFDEESLDDMERAVGYGAGFAGGFLLYIAIITYGMMVMRSVLEEKTGRIAEVILSSMNPRDLMLGKILGVGCVGFTQLGIWVGSGILMASAGLPLLLTLLPQEAVLDIGVLEILRSAAPTIGVVLFFLVCFFLGFLNFATLFTAVGAVCSTEEEAQQFQFPLIMLAIAPMMLISEVLSDPNSTFAVLVSLFPLFTPILMFARVASGAAPIWQAALSILLMAGTLLLAATVVGKIYRTGILMQGKRPTLPEIVRWVREA
jgi:ABC-2 type transport system permease protein